MLYDIKSSQHVEQHIETVRNTSQVSLQKFFEPRSKDALVLNSRKICVYKFSILLDALVTRNDTLPKNSEYMNYLLNFHSI